LKLRRELLSTMFSRNLQWLLGLYRQKVARLASSKPKGAAAREVLEQYVGVYTTLRRLYRYHNRAGCHHAISHGKMRGVSDVSKDCHDHVEQSGAFLEATNVKASGAG